MNSPSLKISYISYDLEVAKSLNNKTAAALLSRLSYWFSKYEQGFYKFMEPCSHKLYRPGDSWTEEMGAARRTLNRAFDLIGVRYKSKRLFLKEKDPFQGKMFASYVDNDTNQTFYLKNPTLLGGAHKGLSAKNPKEPTNKKRVSQNVRCATDKMTDPYKDNKKDFKDIYPPKSPLLKNNTTEMLDVKNKCLLKKEKANLEKRQKSREDINVTEELNFVQKALDIFKKETQGKVSVPSLTPHFASKIKDALEKYFDNCLEKWRLFCRLCASSKWLMGETPSTFKAWFIWLIKDKVIEAIRQRRYGVREDLPLMPEVKITQEDVEEKIASLPNIEERQWRLNLLKKVGLKEYQRYFESMTFRRLEDGRCVVRFGAGGAQAHSGYKQTLLTFFNAKSFETVPAGVSAESHISRWNLQDTEKYPYLFVRN